MIQLPKRLKRPDGLSIELQGQLFKGGKPTGYMSVHAFTGELLDRPHDIRVGINCDELVNWARRKKIPMRGRIKVVISYVPVE